MTTLIIRDAQMDAFADQARCALVAQLRCHLERIFPQRCAALGHHELIAAIGHGMERAASYGISSERDVCKFLDLMFVFGRDFDQATEQPWAARILAHHASCGATELIDRLLARAQGKMYRAFGIAPLRAPQEA